MKISTELTLLNLYPHFVSALHVAPKVKKWGVCNYFIRTNYQKYNVDMTDNYKNLLARKKRILSYNGDLDMACSFLGNQWFVKDLKAPLKRNKRPWFTVVSKWVKSVAVGPFVQHHLVTEHLMAYWILFSL